MQKILVVDGEQSARSLVKRLFSQNYIVLEAMDGEEAINIASNQRPNLILTDIVMPKVDGYTTCFTIKRNRETEGIPVVMLTGLGYELNKKLANQMGADELLHQVKQVLGE